MNTSLALQYFKYLYSIPLLIFSVVLVMACIFSGESTAAEYNINPVLAFFLFWFLICWLAMMEGGQGCIVGLQSVDKKKYSETHPITLKCTNLAHDGDNMERFIVGRQFLVVLVIFLINLCGSAVRDADPISTPMGINTICLGNGLALIITTIDIGQLPSQVNAAVCMLDFINNYFMLFTVHVSLGIELSGLMHSVYLVQHVFATLTGNPVESNELPRTNTAKIFFWARVLMSISILSFALAVTFQALIEGKSGIWDGVPVAASIAIFLGLLCLVGLMEGMQIAAFALLNTPEEELSSHKVAHKNCQLMFNGSNLQSFLIGRQIFAAALMFIVARIATISIDRDAGETNIFNVCDVFQNFIDTGLLGAVILTIIGSLTWRVIASSFPLQFMSNPVIYIVIRICFIMEATGICSAAWILALIHKTIFGFRADDNYTKEDTHKEVQLNIEDLGASYGNSRAKSCAVSFSSNESDDATSKIEKIKSSFFVTAHRYLSVLLTRDLDDLMEETGDIEEMETIPSDSE